MKTPEKIKAELNDALSDHVHFHNGDPEPHLTHLNYHALERLHADALSYIQQLEADNAQLNRCIENMTDKLNALNDELAELQAERDAAIALIPRACAYCKWYGTKHGGFHPDCKNPNGCRNVSGINTGWQWRGVQKEEDNEAT